MERSRTARFKKLKPSPVAYVDSLVRGHAREVYDVIGRGVTENKALAPAIPFVEDFNVTYVRCKPGNGAALHAHETVEVFFVMEGQFTVFWGGSSEHESVLKKWDLISIPPGVYRGFRNSGRARATLMAIFGGTDAGHVAWPKSVLKQARATGMKLDRKGNIISIPAAVRGSRRKA
jgi:mannose-6-phosphate isomerase-like protein (cupin superfamily)